MATIKATVSAHSCFGGQIEMEFVFVEKENCLGTDSVFVQTKNLTNSEYNIANDKGTYGLTIGELGRINIGKKAYVRISMKDIFGKSIRETLTTEPKTIYVEFDNGELHLTYRGITFIFVKKET